MESTRINFELTLDEDALEAWDYAHYMAMPLLVTEERKQEWQQWCKTKQDVKDMMSDSSFFDAYARKVIRCAIEFYANSCISIEFEVSGHPFHLSGHAVVSDTMLSRDALWYCVLCKAQYLFSMPGSEFVSIDTPDYVM